MKLKERLLVPERMDDPDLAETDHVEALRGLRRINTWTGNAQIAWPPVRQIANSLESKRMSLLDVATGSADVPIKLRHFAAASGIRLDVDACDVSQTALRFARRSHPGASELNLFPLDVVSESIPNMYDVVMCSTFLHHLSREHAVEVLRKMRDAARRRVVVVDLERGALNWLMVWLGCHLLSRSQVVHFDGPQSVRAAFSKGEMTNLAQEVGFRSFRVHRRWPCRLLLIGDV